MARSTKKVTIDRMSYEFTQLSPRDSLKVLARLTKLLGAPLGEIINHIPIKVERPTIEDFKGLKIGNVVTQLVERLDEDSAIETIELLFTQVSRNGKSVTLEDIDFQGNLMNLFKCVGHALEVNFSDFFGESVGLADFVRGIAASQSETTPISRKKTGASGA